MDSPDIVHAGLRKEMQGRAGQAISHTLYIALLYDVAITCQDLVDTNHHGDTLALGVAVQLWLHHTRHHLVPYWPTVVDRGFPHKLPDNALLWMTKQHTDLRVLSNMLERLTFDAVPQGQ